MAFLYRHVWCHGSDKAFINHRLRCNIKTDTSLRYLSESGDIYISSPFQWYTLLSRSYSTVRYNYLASDWTIRVSSGIVRKTRSDCVVRELPHLSWDGNGCDQWLKLGMGVDDWNWEWDLWKWKSTLFTFVHTCVGISFCLCEKVTVVLWCTQLLPFYVTCEMVMGYLDDGLLSQWEWM